MDIPLYHFQCKHDDRSCCSYQDLSGFSLGMASILFWLVAQLPQIISNFRNQSAEALSPYFLAEWLLVIDLAPCYCTLGQLLKSRGSTMRKAH